MILPVPASSSVPADDPAKDLRVAMRLMSGKDCERDASTAQVLLLNLAESSRQPFARDADRLLKAGTDRGWFRDKPPAHFELERIARESLNQRDPANDQKLIIALAAGMIALVAGIGLYMMKSSGETEAFPVIAVVVMLMVGGFATFLKRNRR